MSDASAPATPTPAPENTQVVISLDALVNVGAEISSLDAKIAAASGNEAQVRKSITEGFATANTTVIDGILGKLLPNIAELDTDIIAGLLDRLPDALDEEFGPRVNERVDALVTEQTAGAQEGLAGLKEARKSKVEASKALRFMLEQFQIDTSSVPEPKRGGGRTPGSGGGSSASKTGRNKEGYRYSMDGAKRPPSQNALSSLAFYATVGCAGTADKPERWSTAQMKEFIAAQGVVMGAEGVEGAQDTWTVTLPNGKVISAARYSRDTDPDLYKDVIEAEADSDDAPEAPATEAPAPEAAPAIEAPQGEVPQG